MLRIRNAIKSKEDESLGDVKYANEAQRELESKDQGHGEKGEDEG